MPASGFELPRWEVPIDISQSLWLEISIDVPFEFVDPVAQLFSRVNAGNVVLEEGDLCVLEGLAPGGKRAACGRAGEVLQPEHHDGEGGVYSWHQGLQRGGRRDAAPR